DPSRGPHRGAFSREGLVLPGLGGGLTQLVELPAQVLQLALTARAELFEVTHRVRRRDPCAVGRADAGAKVQRASVRIEQLGLSIAVEQSVVLVLPVQRNQPVAQLTQLARGGRATIDPSRPAFADLAQQA